MLGILLTGELCPPPHETKYCIIWYNSFDRMAAGLTHTEIVLTMPHRNKVFNILHVKYEAKMFCDINIQW